MLIFISDLHFIDETAGTHNIHPQAFKGAFSDIANYTRSMSNGNSEVKLVFLGDVFDLIRTTQWLEVPEDERPWGDTQGKADKIESHAIRIMDDILATKYNSETLSFLKNDLQGVFGREVKKIFIPGNHDRLCNVYPSLRQKVRDVLGISGDTEPFTHAYEDRAYGVYAMHGHEFDDWNYAGGPDWTDSDYNQVPLGDLIACEIIAKIPHIIMSNISGSMPQTEKNSFLRNLQEIDNIRPFSAIFKWLFYQVRKNQDLKEIINDSIKETVRNFDNLRFPDNWRMGCNKSPNLVLAMKLKALAKILKYLNISALESIINIYSSIFTASASPDSSDDVLNRGATAFLSRRSDYRYLVMGHTHNPLQMPVKVTGSGEDQIYVNTGTWRKKYFQGTAGGFVGLKYLTYAVFYDREENPSQKFEVWTGTLKEEEKWPR